MHFQKDPFQVEGCNHIDLNFYFLNTHLNHSNGKLFNQGNLSTLLIKPLLESNTFINSKAVYKVPLLSYTVKKSIV